jgi:hypothetical protein
LSIGIFMQTKQCALCREIKLLDEFGWYNKSKNKRQSRCKLCKRKTDNAWKKINHKKLATKMMEYLLEHPCIICKEYDIRLLHFDHLRDKLYNVGDMIRGVHSWENIQKEIEKCQILCTACHTIKSLEDSNSFRSQFYHEHQKPLLKERKQK